MKYRRQRQPTYVDEVLHAGENHGIAKTKKKVKRGAIGVGG